MRALLLAGLAVLPLAALSGCTQVGMRDGTTSFSPTCPNWTRGEHSVGRVGDTTLSNGGQAPTASKTTSNVVPFDGRAPPDEAGKRADRYQLQVAVAVENGTLELRAYRNDTGQQLQLYPATDPAAAQAAWAFPSPSGLFQGTATLQADLGPASADPSPAALRLDATFTAAAGHVIGPDAGATFTMDPYVLYRAAGCRAAA